MTTIFSDFEHFYTINYQRRLACVKGSQQHSLNTKFQQFVTLFKRLNEFVCSLSTKAKYNEQEDILITGFLHLK